MSLNRQSQAAVAGSAAVESKDGAGAHPVAVAPSRVPTTRQGKVKMTGLISDVAAAFGQFTDGIIEPIHNPLSQYGDKTDKGETLWLKAGDLFGRTANTYLSTGNARIEANLATNPYKTRCDRTLGDLYPATGNGAVDRSLEFIIRITRLLLLNTLYHLKEAPAQRRLYLYAIRDFCDFIQEQSITWMSDMSFWKKVFGKEQHCIAFASLFQDLSSMLDKDIKQLDSELVDKKLPNALNKLLEVQEELARILPRATLTSLLDRHVPEDFFSSPEMIRTFSNESLAFYEFKKSAVHKDFKAVIINPKNDNDDSIFQVVKFLFGARRNRLRDQVAKIGMNQGVASVQGAGEALLTHATQTGLITAGEFKEEKTTELASTAAAPISMALTAQQPADEKEQKSVMVAASARQLTAESLSPEMQLVAEEYHRELDKLADPEFLAKGLAPVLSSYYFNTKGTHSPQAAAEVHEFVETITKFIYLYEQVIHLGHNLRYAIDFHPQGGNIFTKMLLPLPNVSDSAIQVFTHFRTLSEQLKEQVSGLGLLEGIKNQMNLRLNGMRANVLLKHGLDRIQGEGLANLQAMQQSLTIESLRGDMHKAVKNVVGMIVQQVALQRLTVKISPQMQPFLRVCADISAQHNHKLAITNQANQRIQDFAQGQLQSTQPQMLPLQAPIPTVFPIGRAKYVKEISLATLENAALPDFELTVKDVQDGSIYQENRDTAFLEIKNTKRRILLAPDAIERVRAMQGSGQPQAMRPLLSMMAPTAPVRDNEISQEDIITNNLSRHNLTLKQVLNAAISERAGQAYLEVTENGNPQKYMLAQNAKPTLLVLKAAIRELRPVAVAQTVVQQTPANSALAEAKAQLAVLEEKIKSKNALYMEKIKLRDEKIELKAAKENLGVEKRLHRSLLEAAQPQHDRRNDISAKLARGWIAATLIGLPVFIIAQLYRFAKRASIHASLEIYNAHAATISTLNTESDTLRHEVSTLATEITALNNEIETINQGRALNRAAKTNLTETIQSLQNPREQKGQPTQTAPVVNEVKRPQQAPTPAPTPLTVVVAEPTPAPQPATVSPSVAQAAATPLPASPTDAPAKTASPKGVTQAPAALFTPAPEDKDMLRIAMVAAQVGLITTLAEQAAKKVTNPATFTEEHLRQLFKDAALGTTFQSSFKNCKDENTKKDLANIAFDKFKERKLPLVATAAPAKKP